MRTAEVTRIRRWIIPRLGLEFTADEYADLSDLVTAKEALVRLIGLWNKGRLEVWAPINPAAPGCRLSPSGGWCVPMDVLPGFRPGTGTKWVRRGRWVCVLHFRLGRPHYGLPDGYPAVLYKEDTRAAK